VFIYPG